MPELSEYTLDLVPEGEVSDFVKQQKEKLKKAVDWYSSANSDPHISVCYFSLESSGIEALDFRSYFNQIKSFHVVLNNTGTFPGTFYLAPDFESSEKIRNLFSELAGKYPSLKLKNSSAHPHMTIGKKLKPQQIKKAEEIFSGMPIDISFRCDNIALRKLTHYPDGKINYVIQERFPFQPL